MKTTLWESTNLDDAAITTDLVAAGDGWPVTKVTLVSLGDDLHNPRGQQLVGTELLVDERYHCQPGWRRLIKTRCAHGRYIDQYAGGCDECLEELADEHQFDCDYEYPTI